MLHLIHDDWSLQMSSIVVYTYIPIANEPCLWNWGHYAPVGNDMTVESWPPLGSSQRTSAHPLRLRQRYHGDWNLRNAPIVIYTYISNANEPWLWNWCYNGVTDAAAAARDDYNYNYMIRITAAAAAAAGNFSLISNNRNQKLTNRAWEEPMQMWLWYTQMWF